MSDARERAQEWLKFHDLQIDDLHQLVADLLAALSDAGKERDEAIAEQDRYKAALEKIAADNIGAIYPLRGETVAGRQSSIAKSALGGGE